MQYYEYSFKAMGGPGEFKFYAESPVVAQHVQSLMLAEVRRIEAKYSRYSPESVTSKINLRAGEHNATSVDEETIALINYAKQLYQQSEGLFDITSGVLRKAWNFKANILPTEETLSTLLQLVNWHSVEFDQQTIRLPKAGMEIDFGGFVKEYAADTTAVKAIEQGITHGLVNLSGDIRAIGPHPDGSPWRVGIQHPRKLNAAIASVDLYGGAIATSGDYERFMIVDGKRYCHLLNPSSGKSIHPYYASISVIAQACLIAGSFSTIGLLKSETDSQWIAACGLPHLCIDTALRTSGTIASHVLQGKESTQIKDG